MSSFSAAVVPYQEAVVIGEELRKKDKEQADLSLSESEDEDLSNPGESPTTPHQSVSGSESSGFRGFNVPDVNPVVNVVARDVEESETTVFRAKTVVQQAPPPSHPTPMEEDDGDMPEPSVPGPSMPGPSRPEPLWDHNHLQGLLVPNWWA